MSASINDGGPAFAVLLGLNLTAKSAAQKGIMSGQQTTEIQSTGSSVNVGLEVSLRDYFAAEALNGSLASQCEDSHWVFSNIPDDIKNDTGALSGIARLSYDLADAMLKAREAKL